jgi:hypothetical protein
MQEGSRRRWLTVSQKERENLYKITGESLKPQQEDFARDGEPTQIVK